MKPGNIVGAIANEAGLDSKRIGRVDIRDDYSLVDLPAGMPDDILQHLKGVWVVGQQLRIVEDGKPFDAPRKPGKLALGDDQPRTGKPGSASQTRQGAGPRLSTPETLCQACRRQRQAQDLNHDPLQRKPMKQRLALAGCTALLLIVTGCDQLGNKAPTPAETNAGFDAFVKAVARKPAAELTPDELKEAVNQYVGMQVAAEPRRRRASTRTPRSRRSSA